MSPARRPLLLALALAAGLPLGLGGCLPQASLPQPATTPLDPPRLPPRRPPPPPDFLAQAPVSPAPVPQASQTRDRLVSQARDTDGTRMARNVGEGGPITAGLYRIRPGDTVYSIAQRAGLPLRAVIDVNRLEPPYPLTVGRDLIVPRARVHVVKAGETVYGISRLHGVDMSELTRLNGVGTPYEIRIGQRLVLPDPGTRQVAAAPAPAPPPPTGAPSAPPAEAQAGTQQSQTQTQTPAAGQPPLPPRRPQTRVASEPAAPRAPAPAATPPTRHQTAAIPQPPARAGGRFAWPIRGSLLARYGPQDGGRHNDGINIAAPRGAPILAAENGVVAYVGSELKGFGKLVLVKHADGWVTAYAHADSVAVRLGETVRRGQPIARVGSSGAVDQPQLHFEIRKGTNAIDPLQMLEDGA